MKLQILSILACLTALSALGAPKGDPSKPYYQNVVPGLPTGGGTRTGGIWAERVPEPDIVYRESEGEKSADHWQTLSKWTAIGAIVLLFAWYLLKTRLVAGMALLSLGISFGCTVMAEIVTKAWIMAVLILLVGALLAIGYLLRNRSVINWVRDIWDNRKNKPQPNKPEAEGLKG